MMEYLVIEKVYPAQLQRLLNGWGIDGWRLVGYTEHVVILEREKS